MRKNDFSLKIFIFIIHMFDCSKFLNRIGWVQRDLAEKLGCSQSAIAMWSSGKTSPPYSAIIKLIELGASSEELFGADYAKLLERNNANTMIDGFSKEGEKPTMQIPKDLITEGVKKALVELMGLDKTTKEK